MITRQGVIPGRELYRRPSDWVGSSTKRKQRTGIAQFVMVRSTETNDEIVFARVAAIYVATTPVVILVSRVVERLQLHVEEPGPRAPR